MIQATEVRLMLAKVFLLSEKNVINQIGGVEIPNNKNLIVCFRVSNTEAKTPAFYTEVDNVNVAQTIATRTIDLQFIGAQAEEAANSVTLWHLRGDVEEELNKYDCKFLNAGNITSSYYAQDGLNTILAYNVSVRIAGYITQDTTQGHIRTAEIGGVIKTQPPVR